MAAKKNYTAREDGSVRMKNSKGFEYWIVAKDVDYLLENLPDEKKWSLVPDPAEGKEHGPTGPPRK